MQLIGVVVLHDLVLLRELLNLRSGYGMLATKHNDIVDADGLVYSAIKDNDDSSVCDMGVRDKLDCRSVSVHNAYVISGRIERPAKQAWLLAHLKQGVTFRAERNDP